MRPFKRSEVCPALLKLKGGTKMSHTRIVEFFSQAVNYVAENIAQYVHRPSADFTRNNKLPITKLLPFLVSQGSSSTRNELTEAYNFSADRPSASAFSQQRAKLKPEGLEALFHQFTTSLDTNRNIRIKSMNTRKKPGGIIMKKTLKKAGGIMRSVK